MLWDRLFGTFVEETERCVYGTRALLDSWDPLRANLEVYVELARRSRHAGRWQDSLRVWLMPPDRRPAAATWHGASFDLAQVRIYDPPMSPAVRVVALVQLAVGIVAALSLLWYSDTMPRGLLGASALSVVALLATVATGAWAAGP